MNYRSLSASLVFDKSLSPQARTCLRYAELLFDLEQLPSTLATAFPSHWISTHTCIYFSSEKLLDIRHIASRNTSSIGLIKTG